MKPFLRSAHNYDMREAGKASALICEDETLTKQEFRDECDINTLVRRFGLTGELPKDVRMPTFGDFTGVENFQDAANAIARANEAFDEMPADVRRRFENDPAKFVEFCSDAGNIEEARRLGLVPAAEVAPGGPGGGESGPAPAVGGSPAAASASSGGAAQPFRPR